MIPHRQPRSSNSGYGVRCAGHESLWSIPLSTPIIATLVISLLASATGAQSFVRATPPVVGRPARLVVPEVRTGRLGNGIVVQVVEQRELPLVHILAVFAGGSRLDGPRAGMATFVANMLDEGAGSHDPESLQAELAYLGASLLTSADWDRTTISLKVPLRSLGSALDLMADVIARPRFSANEVRRQRDLRLANLLQQRDQPNALADLAFYQVVYPKGHPYHGNANGDSASTALLDSAAVRAFYRRTIRPNLARVVVVGDLADADARAAIAKRFEGWTASGPTAAPAAVTTLPLRQATSRLYLVDKPNAAQSVINIGWPGVDRLSVDYAPLMVMNSLLGGSFTSRLNMNLREQKGFTYGAGSRFSFRKVPGPFIASASVRTNVTDSSLVEFLKELRAVRDTLVPNDEVERAKSYAELGIPGSLESTAQVATSITQLANFGLPLTDLARFAARVRAVTPADIRRVARKYLTPDRATIVVVGDLSRTRAGIEALHLGPITTLDVARVSR